MEKLQSETEKEMDQKLGRAAQLIKDLEHTQNERLSRKPPPHLQYVQGPSDQEHALAEQLTQQLRELSSKVRLCLLLGLGLGLEFTSLCKNSEA